MPSSGQTSDQFTASHSGAMLAAVPTPAQAAAGNYRLGMASWRGMPIRIETPALKSREGVDEDGRPWRSIMAAHYGYFAGTSGADGDAVDVFLGPAPENPIAWIINQTKRDGRFDEHKVMVGFDSAESAVRAYVHSYSKGWNRFDRTPVRMTARQLRWWLHYADKRGRAGLHQLPISERKETVMDHTDDNTAADALQADRIALPTMLWDSAGNLGAGVTHELALYRLRALDGANDLMMDPLSMADIMEGAELLTMDALVVEVGRLKPKMEAIQRLMGGVPMSAGVSVTGLELSDPFKKLGVTQVAAIFSMSDGQTVTILLHNPDSTPNKLTPADLLVSWKWMLNKRDITAAVAPERGVDLSPREVATRVMKLVNANAKAFARTQALAAGRSATIKDLRQELADKQARLADLNQQIDAERPKAAERAAQREAAAQAEAEAAAAAAAEAEAAARRAEEDAKPAPDPAPAGKIPVDVLTMSEETFAEWEDKITTMVEFGMDVDRSDAQSIVEAFDLKKGAGTLRRMFNRGVTADDAYAEIEGYEADQAPAPGPAAAPAPAESPSVAVLREVAAGKHDDKGYRDVYVMIRNAVMELGETLAGDAAEAADAAILHWVDIEEATPA